MLAQPITRSSRRPFRFSVRALVVVVIVVGIGLGWIVHRAHLQRDTVATIKSTGGSVTYEWEWNGKTAIPGARPWAPRLLVDFIGVDYFGRVSDVYISRGTDAVMAQVACLNRIERLQMWESPVTDAGLSHLRRLSELSALNVGDTRITDAGLVHLKGLKKLSLLCVPGRTVTDAGLNELKHTLPNLTVVRYGIPD